MDISSPVNAVAGVGPKKQTAFAALGITTVGGLLYHFPRGYQNRGNTRTLVEAAALGEMTAMILTVGSRPKTVLLKNHKTMTKFVVFDETGRCNAKYFNQNYIQSVFNIGDVFRFWGRVERFRSEYQISAPDFEPVNTLRPLAGYYPVYPLTAGISQKVMQNIIGTALAALDCYPESPVPLAVRQRCGIVSLKEALISIHRPSCPEALEAAKKYFAFEELFVFASGVLGARRESALKRAFVINSEHADMQSFYSCLPFALTGAQRRVIDEIMTDFGSGHAMRRLIQGDVGSGKTVCAAAAVYAAVKNGFQCALMAPTEILAAQHFGDLSALLEPLGIKCVLLTGSMGAAAKRAVHRASASGEVDFIIGTHALISDGMSFKNAALVITDEQHRFGVGQRSALADKASGSGIFTAHNLAMSATPIPRTLALVMLSDVDVSVIDEMPPGRKKVSTFLVDEGYRERLEGFICKQAYSGKQTYIVCPSIENSGDEDEDCEIIGMDGVHIIRHDEIKLKSVLDYYSGFSVKYPNIKTAYIHGKMPGREKDRIMCDFADGKISVLISTTVIEVGVNVPNATLMVVENADRFGLSQLHQLRGRVGRGKDKSWCILVSDSREDGAEERLQALCQSDNGFEIAQTDLSMRGPGDFFATIGGERQHGEPVFRFASLCDNSDAVNSAFAEAKAVLEDDPGLQNEENHPLAARLAENAVARCDV